MGTSSALSTNNQYIKYKITVTQNSQNITNNTSNVTVSVKFYRTNTGYSTYGTGTVYCKINGTTYSASVTSSQKITNSGIVLFSKTLNISHSTDGTKTLATSAWISHTQVTSSEQSYNQDLTTIPRKSSLSVGNGTLNTQQTLTVSRQSNSFTHTIVATCGSASHTIATKSTSTTIYFTPPISWASQNTSGTSVSIKYTITTYNGSTNIGSNSYTKTCSIPASVKPSVSFTISDPTGFFDKYGNYVQGYSKLKIDVTASSQHGATIATYTVSANGVTYNKSSVTTDVLRTVGVQGVVAYVVDTRGRTAVADTSINPTRYVAPAITTLSVRRCNEDGTANDEGEFAKVTFSGNVTALNNKNSVSYKLKYKKSSESTYTEVVLTDYANKYSVSNASYIFPADSGSSYDVNISIVDDLSEASRTTALSTGFTIIHWKASGKGLAFGKISELDDVLDIGFETRFYGGILHPVLEPNTDLNDVRTPNTYVGANTTTYKYLNCPIDTGTFTFDVVGMGEDGQVKQRLTSCIKDTARTYERIYYQSSWGEWVCVSDYGNTLLWSGGYYMTAGHIISFAEKASKQPSGIVLVWSEIVDGSAKNQSWHSDFIPKKLITSHSGTGHVFQMSTSNLAFYATKYLYIRDDGITGHDNNNLTGTGASGITFTNGRFVLRYVIGV